MDAWSPDQIETLRGSGPAENRWLEILEAAALLYLDERDRILCTLSRNDGEWTEGNITKSNRKRLKVLYSLMDDAADGLVDDQQTLNLIWGVLDRICTTNGYTPTVWEP